MTNIGKLLPIMHKIVEKKRCAISITMLHDKITVNIVKRFCSRQFEDTDSNILIAKLDAYLQR